MKLFPLILHGITLQICIIGTFSTKIKQEIFIHPPTVHKPSQGSSNSQIINLPNQVDFQVDIPGQDGGQISPTVFPIVRPTSRPGSVAKGMECGATRQMFAGQIVQIFSTNFNITNYQNYESCSWKFEANHCILSADCPCVEIPKSWECLGDYLRISTDYIRQYQRFCGGNRPGQPIYSESDFLNIKFRSDGRITAAGFTCFIRCEGPGMNIPPNNMACPTSLVYKGQRNMNYQYK